MRLAVNAISLPFCIAIGPELTKLESNLDPYNWGYKGLCSIQPQSAFCQITRYEVRVFGGLYIKCGTTD